MSTGCGSGTEELGKISNICFKLLNPTAPVAQIVRTKRQRTALAQSIRPRAKREEGAFACAARDCYSRHPPFHFNLGFPLARPRAKQETKNTKRNPIPLTTEAASSPLENLTGTNGSESRTILPLSRRRPRSKKRTN